MARTPAARSLQYSCFISYYKGQHALIHGFMEDLTEALSSSLEPWMPRHLKVYRDTRLDPGVLFQKELARALCQSLCMILVYTPAYRKSDFCRREFAAMRLLERRRHEWFQRAGINGAERGMIIPIILRGAGDLPAELQDHVNCLNFSGYTTEDQSIIRNGAYIEEIDRIAEYVFGLHAMFERSGMGDQIDCDGFELPDETFPEFWPDKGPGPTQEFPF
jgi:hypothetical protein